MPTQETMASNITPMPTSSIENTMPLPNLNTIQTPTTNDIPSVQTPKIEPTISNINLEPNQKNWTNSREYFKQYNTSVRTPRRNSK